VPDLEERVAALEAALVTPLRPAEAWTGEQVAEFRKRLTEAAGRRDLRILPQPPPLSPDEVRCLLRECVTAVKPGETLVISSRDWTPSQIREIQRILDAAHEDGTISFRVLALPGGELGVVQPESDEGFIKRLERVWPEFRRREMLRERASQMRLPGSAL
jgi:hypothetical protein